MDKKYYKVKCLIEDLVILEKEFPDHTYFFEITFSENLLAHYFVIATDNYHAVMQKYSGLPPYHISQLTKEEFMKFKVKTVESIRGTATLSPFPVNLQDS